MPAAWRYGRDGSATVALRCRLARRHYRVCTVVYRGISSHDVFPAANARTVDVAAMALSRNLLQSNWSAMLHLTHGLLKEVNLEPLFRTVIH